MLELLQAAQETSPQRGLHLYDDFADDASETVRYGDLPERVAGCARHLREQGVGPGTRVIFPFETSSAVVLTFLALIEVGALPLSVKPLVGTPRETYRDFLGRVADTYGADRVLDVPSLAELDLPVARLPLPPEGVREPGARLRTPAGDELAFVQFSSGSTSFPKGVPIRHDRLRANLGMTARTIGAVPTDRVSAWLPLYHDMGLVGTLLTSLSVGCDVMLGHPAAFMGDALEWWRHMARVGATLTYIPNFAVDYSLKLLARGDPDEELDGVDLSALRGIYLGSEPINIPNLRAFLEVMAPAGLHPGAFMPCYGMAETVLIVSSRPVGAPPRVVTGPSGLPAISVGAVLPEYDVRLRDEAGRICGENELGEIELARGTVASSYFEHAEPLGGADGFFATGDVGFVDDGELFITGRNSDRIKVNGQSYFSADFEQALERLPFVHKGRTAVAQIDRDIIVLAEVSSAARDHVPGSRAQVVEQLATTLGVTVRAEDVHYVHPGQITRTSSGKIQRRAIANAYRDGSIRAFTLDRSTPRAVAGH